MMYRTRSMLLQTKFLSPNALLPDTCVTHHSSLFLSGILSNKFFVKTLFQLSPLRSLSPNLVLFFRYNSYSNWHSECFVVIDDDVYVCLLSILLPECKSMKTETLFLLSFFSQHLPQLCTQRYLLTIEWKTKHRKWTT